jgi:branched-subunit amino acid permease
MIMKNWIKYEIISMVIYFFLAVWVSLHRFIIIYEDTLGKSLLEMLLFWTIFYVILKLYVWNEIKRKEVEEDDVEESGDT